MCLGCSDPFLRTVLIERGNRLTGGSCCQWWRAGEVTIREGKQGLEKGIPGRGRDDEDKFGCFVIV